MSKVLISFQSFTGNCKALAEAAARGVAEAGGQADVKNVAETTAPDLAGHDAFILVTPQPFQSLAGETKTMFERLWPERAKIQPGLPFAAVICHGTDAAGSAVALDMFTKYFGWKKAGDWLLASMTSSDRQERARQLGIAVAQGG
ncbi:flavodoxin [Dehalogenimonas sp. 4OHTPN]|uniref:Flavodoxin n=1 Tax=Dehalogenimonas sp. 4OHTPN TaxID=3166643 RepID=A0AAU8G8N7_9CHLR